MTEGLTTCLSNHGQRATMDRLLAAVEAHGMTVFARIDHAAAAASVGMELRPTEVVIFGNPRAGTLLMQAVQTMGIDLPLEILVWQDEAGKTWVSYNEPKWLATRHHTDAGATPTVDAMTAVVAVVAKEATQSAT
jgi:uncharacterized protein (DUF302 family)